MGREVAHTLHVSRTLKVRNLASLKVLGRFRARKALVKLPGLGAQVSQGTVEDRDQAPVAGEEDTSRLGVRVCVSEERRGSQADSTESRVDWGVDEGEVGCP